MLLVLGSYLVITQQINIAQFVAAEIIVLLISNSVDKFVTGMPLIYDTLTALEKIGYVTDIKLENDSGKKFEDYCTDNRVELTFNKLSYKFSDSNNYVIKDLDLVIKPGEKVCVLGNKGSGKSTLINFICGFYDRYEGQVLYNNIPLSNLDLDSLRTRIGDNTKDQDVFYGTIKDNITIGLEVSQDKINEVLKICGLEKFVYSQYQGLETMLHHEGRQLSRTVIRKILLARSIIKDPSIILFDEYIFDFDAAEKEKLINYLTAKDKNWTIVANSNDFDFVSKCDRVLVFNDGKLEGDFPVEKLLTKLSSLNLVNTNLNLYVKDGNES
jgi:ABC-type bacteriocin/lantibiotic exporter with double-glycine peptidase domain